LPGTAAVAGGHTGSLAPSRWASGDLGGKELPLDLDVHGPQYALSSYLRQVMRTAAFSMSDEDRANAVAQLGALGFEFGPSRPESRTLLDTFDGRFHNAGLRLELVETDGSELILSGEGAVTAHLAVTTPPRFAADLTPGPFRARVAALIDVRALLPLVRLARFGRPPRRTTGPKRSSPPQAFTSTCTWRARSPSTFLD
jgi:hypothetical protein